MMDGQLETAEEQYQNLLQAKSKPHILDDYTIQHVIKLYKEEIEFIPVYEQQLAKRYLIRKFWYGQKYPIINIFL